MVDKDLEKDLEKNLENVLKEAMKQWSFPDSGIFFDTYKNLSISLWEEAEEIFINSDDEIAKFDYWRERFLATILKFLQELLLQRKIKDLRLSPSVIKKLHDSKVETIGELLGLSEKTIRAFPRCGERAVMEIRSELDRHGLSLKKK